MKRKRSSQPYKAYALAADGTRPPLDAHGIVVELRPGIEVEIDFAPHPAFAGQLTMLTPPPPEMERAQKRGLFDNFAVFFGGANVLHVWVERREVGRAKAPRASSTKKRPRTRP
jgi:hypothetical protein